MKKIVTAMFAAGLLSCAAVAAFAQPMNNSGTNVPDTTDRGISATKGKSTTAQMPDTRSKKVRKKVVRKHRR
jgi:hypothetical protein